VLANGEIVEEGTHESLLEKRGEYFKFYSMQFKDENRNSIEKTSP
jgi:ABC-type multidrug transport system fused ATPase/permease subunit